MKTKIAASAFLLLLVTACGADADPEAASEVDTPSADVSDATSDEGEPEPSPTEDEAGPAVAKRALREAVKTMEHDEVTGFESHIRIVGETYGVTTGVAVASGWESSSVFNGEGETTYVMNVRSTDGAVWMQMDKWAGDAHGCWLSMDAGGVPVGILAMRPDVPGYFSLLGLLRTSGFADETQSVMVGDLLANGALGLLTAQVAAELDLTGVRPSDRVPVEIGYDGSRVSSVAMSGSDFLQMVESAGGSASATARAALEATEITVAYSKPEKPVTVSAPPANLVMTADELKSGCH